MARPAAPDQLPPTSRRCARPFACGRLTGMTITMSICPTLDTFKPFFRIDRHAVD